MAQTKLSLTFMYEIDPSKASGLHYKHFFYGQSDVQDLFRNKSQISYFLVKFVFVIVVVFIKTYYDYNQKKKFF